jgi:Predicted membrane protein (DUF2127)
MKKRCNGLLSLIAIFKLVKAVTLIGVGLGALRLVHDNDIADSMIHLTARLGLNPGGRYLDHALARLVNLPSKDFRGLGIGSFVYAALGHEALFQLFRIQSREYPVERRLRAIRLRVEKFCAACPARFRQRSSLKPTSSIQCSLFSMPQCLFQQMLPVPLHTWITQLRKILQGILHIPFSPRYTRTAYSNLYASALTKQGPEVLIGNHSCYFR